MLSPEDTGYGSNGSIIRASRAASRRELIKSKRTRQTDMLPGTPEEEGQGKTARLQSIHYLREENVRLRRELETLQEQLETSQEQLEAHRTSMDLMDGEIETIHHAHQQEIEQYQHHLRDMMEERNQMQDLNSQLEQRYQELYRTFQDAVEEEANKLVKEAAQTLVLSPEHTPPLLSDVAKTLEEQAKQTEDQKTAELLSVMHQVQYKAELLEQEVAQERMELAAERENLNLLRQAIGVQAQQRYRADRKRLKARWTAGLTFISLSLFALMVVLELVFDSLKFPFAVTLFVPLAICAMLSYVFARIHTSGRVQVQVKASPPKASTRPQPKKAPVNQAAKSPSKQAKQVKAPAR